MVSNETLSILSNITNVSPTLISKEIFYIFNIVKTAGIVFVAYIIIMIVQTILRIKDRNRIKRIEEKLDLLIEKNKKKKLSK